MLLVTKTNLNSLADATESDLPCLSVQKSKHALSKVSIFKMLPLRDGKNEKKKKKKKRGELCASPSPSECYPKYKPPKINVVYSVSQGV